MDTGIIPAGKNGIFNIIMFKINLFHYPKKSRYRTRTIITRGLYIFYSFFQCGLESRAVNITDNLCTKQGIPRFMIHSGFKSRAGYNGMCMVYILIISMTLIFMLM